MSYDTMDKLQIEIGGWGERTFKHHLECLPAIHAHLAEEVEELEEAITCHLDSTLDYKGSVAEECADVFILLCSIAHLCGINLRQAVNLKMAENHARKWGKPEADGRIHHVPTEPCKQEGEQR